MCKQRAKGEASEFSLGVQLRELVDVGVLFSEGKRSKLGVETRLPS